MEEAENLEREQAKTLILYIIALYCFRLTAKQQIVKIPKGYVLQVSSFHSHGNPNSSEIRDAIKAAGFTDEQTIQQGGDPYRWIIVKPQNYLFNC